MGKRTAKREFHRDRVLWLLVFRDDTQLTGSATWADLEGQTVVHRVWGGRANLAEYKGDGPGGHIELLALRWFNPNTREWNLDFATPKCWHARRAAGSGAV